MTTLTGNEVYEYFEHLEKETARRMSTSKEGSLQYLAHSTLGEIARVEREFLKYVNSNGTQPVLSISPNGLPSVDSLNPDLEKAYELSQEGEFQYGLLDFCKREDFNESHEGYEVVDENEFSKSLKKYPQKKLETKSRFAISEIDGKLELMLQDKFFIKSFDELSQTYPIAIKSIKAQYQVAWGNLVSGIESEYLVHDTPKALTILQNNKNELKKKPKDLVSEIVGDTATGVYFASKNVAKATAKGVSMGVVEFSKGIFIFPSFIRRRERESKLTDTAVVVGFFSTIVLGIAAFVSDSHWLGTPLVTNALSGFYEYGRYNKNKKSNLEHSSNDYPEMRESMRIGRHEKENDI